MALPDGRGSHRATLCFVLIAITVTAAALLAWLYLLACHGGFWRTDQRLPRAAPRGPGAPGVVPRAGRAGGRPPGAAPRGVPGGRPPGAAPRTEPPAAWPAVVAIVPARDEADVLPGTLPTLLEQVYEGRFSVVLVDDESADGTARIASALDAAGRLKIVSGRPTPPGWAGKVWAMAQGVQAADDAEYLLFTDADIGYRPGTLASLVASAGDRALVSQMALLRTDTPAERLLIPAFVYFFAQLYPFRRVNGRRSRTAAAAGGCMLVRREALAAAGGLDRIRDARIDDVALGRLLKRAGYDCWLGFTTDVISYRAYGFTQAWDMVARSAYTQLRYSPAALFGTVIGLTWLYLVPPAAALAGLALLAAGGGAAAIWLAATGAAAWAIMSVSYAPMLRLSRLSLLRAPTLPLIATLYAAMTLSSAWRHHQGRGGEWKGRTIRTPREADRST